ncbi:MAG TPA: YceI family protein, partial [Cytophagaceae bacterium]
MNHKISFPILILITAPLFFFGCRGSVTEENKNNASARSISLHVGDEKYFLIDTKESVVTWKGSSVQGAHTGYVDISKGELIIENGKFMGGTVEIDMNTIVDEKHRSDNNLIKHLKDPDFFDVKKFPISTIAITKAVGESNQHIKVTGNLSIKDITQRVTFPAK